MAHYRMMCQLGTEQDGCPLSPLLFILTLEPFIWTVNNLPSIWGFQVGTKTYKPVAYADDLLFFYHSSAYLIT